MKCGETIINTFRRLAGRKTKNGARFCSDVVRDELGYEVIRAFGGRADYDFYDSLLLAMNC